MACDPYVRNQRNDLQAAIEKLFTEFVKPCNVLEQLCKFLTRAESERVRATTSSSGDTEGASCLLSKLANKENWFSVLLEVLCDTNVKLQHVANMMKVDQKIFEESQHTTNGFRRYGTAASVQSASSRYIEYNRKLEELIRELFVGVVKQESVLRVFHNYSDNVLTVIDIENVEAKVNNHGNKEGVVLLLDRLVLYEDWFTVLMKVLRDTDVEMEHLAQKMEQITLDLRQQYEDDKAKTSRVPTRRVFANLHGNTDLKCPVNQNVSDSAQMTYITGTRSFTEEYESDCAEMTTVADGLPHRSLEAVARTESDSHPLEEVGTSIDDSSVETQLLTAAKVGNTEQLMVLLTQTSDINCSSSEGYTALMCAALKGHTECVQLLIMNGCDVHITETHGNTALMIAADKGQSECMRLLINGGANIDASNRNETTALMVAARKGLEDCVRLLLENRCNPDKLHKDGRTALMYAADNGHSECVKVLIDFGCHVNMADSNENTALIYAAKCGHSKCVEQLLDAGADVDKPGQDNNTAVMLAVVYNRVECLRLLISRQANLDISNKHGYTPRKVAYEKQYFECFKLIREAKKANK